MQTRTEIDHVISHDHISDDCGRWAHISDAWSCQYRRLVLTLFDVANTTAASACQYFDQWSNRLKYLADAFASTENNDRLA
jgi:hypothetical protein